MRLHEITETHHHQKAKRLGRGIAAGGGKTAGRGTKGQKSRTGANSNIPRTFDGGATSMIERLPKLKGFKSHRIKPVTLNIARVIAAFPSKQEVTLTNLVEKGLVSPQEAKQGVKIVGSSKEITHQLTFATGEQFSLSKKLAA